MSEQPNSPANPQEAPQPQVIKGPDFKPVGMLLRPEDLSEAEKRILKQQGWDGESEIPSDLPHRLEVQDTSQLQQEVARASQQLPDGFVMPEKDLDVDKVEVRELDKLPDELVQKFAQVAEAVQATAPVNTNKNSAFEQARLEGVTSIREEASNNGLHPDIARAVQELDAPQSETGKPQPAVAPEKTEQPQPSADTPSKEPKDQGADYQEQMRRQAERMKAATGAEDRKKYAHAIINGEPFTKTYKVLGDKISLTFREISPADEEEIQSQLVADNLLGRLPNNFERVRALTRQYNLAAALMDITIEGDPGPRFQVPAHVSTAEYIADTMRPGEVNLPDFEKDDRPLRGWSQFIRTRVLNAGLHALVNMKFSEFQDLLLGLRIAAQDSDFFSSPA